MKTLMAKEKAKELVQRFIDAETLKDFQDMDMYLAKQCAIIAVDEKITSLEQIKHPANTKRTNRRIDRYIYELEEIKREIEIL